MSLIAIAATEHLNFASPDPDGFYPGKEIFAQFQIDFMFKYIAIRAHPSDDTVIQKKLQQLPTGFPAFN